MANFCQKLENSEEVLENTPLIYWNQRGIFGCCCKWLPIRKGYDSFMGAWRVSAKRSLTLQMASDSEGLRLSSSSSSLNNYRTWKTRRYNTREW